MVDTAFYSKIMNFKNNECFLFIIQVISNDNYQ